jgi:hypothetical protein
VRGHHGRDHMLVGFTTTTILLNVGKDLCIIFTSIYNELFLLALQIICICCDFSKDYMLVNFSFSFLIFSVVFSGTPVSSINKTDCHDITEILLKVVLNTITLTLTPHIFQTLDETMAVSLVICLCW